MVPIEKLETFLAIVSFSIIVMVVVFCILINWPSTPINPDEDVVGGENNKE